MFRLCALDIGIIWGRLPPIEHSVIANDTHHAMAMVGKPDAVHPKNEERSGVTKSGAR
jgi:hypothetical protein